MKIKRFQNIVDGSGMLNDILEEGVISKLICNFIINNNIQYIDNIIIGDLGSFFIFIDKNYKNNILRRKSNKKPEEILIGIPRYKGRTIYESILKQVIDKYKDLDVSLLEDYFIKKDSEKYNL